MTIIVWFANKNAQPNLYCDWIRMK